MRAITFYSYKGGVGRTLLVANLAKYLARFGQRVFAIDFDLEAPGLYYKLTLDDGGPRCAPGRGLVDVVRSFTDLGTLPDSLQQYVVQVLPHDESGLPVTLLPAGNAPNAEYWETLSRVDWHGLFRSAGAGGVGLFLELKERIRQEFAPDFLLIDARTGVTEIGGVATCILADHVVCLLLNNRENLEGAREVLRSIKRADRLPGQEPVLIHPVMTRLPVSGEPQAESVVLARAVDAMNEEAPDLAGTLNISEMMVLHSEPELEWSEALRVGGGTRPADSILLRDYLQLFARLFPADVFAPHISQMIEKAFSQVLDEPDWTERQLEELAEVCPYADVQRALVKFYRLRQKGPATVLEAAARLWETTRDASDPVIRQAVHRYLEAQTTGMRRGEELQHPEVVEGVWRAEGGTDRETALRLCSAYALSQRPEQATSVILAFIEGNDGRADAVVTALNQLARWGDWHTATAITERFKGELGENPEFQVAWARWLAERGHVASAGNASADPAFRFDVVASADPYWAARLLETLGASEEAKDMLPAALRQALSLGVTSKLIMVGELYAKHGLAAEFEEAARSRLPESEADVVLRYLSPSRSGTSRPRRRLSTE